IPLMYQPGSTFEYSVSTDILGHVVERVTGKSLDVALDEMVLKPLGMRDTVFQVTGPRLARLANARPNDPDMETMNWL
ncbi:serine hydrolase domain-containing protein, partial [Acinetobacter baumannii]